MEKIYECPVCGKHNFEDKGDYDICPVCGWENDGLQYSDHNYAGGANELSVNEARIEFFLSNTENADEAKRIKGNYTLKKDKIKQKYDVGEERIKALDAARKGYIDRLNKLLNK